MNNQIIKLDTVDLKTLVSKDTKLSINFQSKMIKELQETFVDEQQRWYIANFYIYLNYHPTNDFPINLDQAFKIIGFAHKKNAKRTLENNFTVNEDYKILVLPKEQQLKNGINLGGAGQNEETIMLNTNTFKELCMLVKTEKGKEIRKYYIKLENIFNKIINEERLEFETQVKLLTNKVEDTLKNSFDKRCVVYLIKILLENNEIIYKFGLTDDIVTRLRTHKLQIGENIELIFCIESDNNKLLEKQLKDYLEQYNFRIKKVINDKYQTELLKVNDIEIIKNKLIELNKNINNDKLVIMELKNQIIQLEHKIIELENKNIQLEKELLKNDNQIISELQNKLNDIQNQENIKEQRELEQLQNLQNNVFIRNINTDVIIEEKIHKKRKVDKIDPTNLQILETYESISSILTNNPDIDYSYNQIYRCIKNNNVYCEYRWNYHGEEIKPTNKITDLAPKVARVVQLNADREFVAVFQTKSELCKSLTPNVGLTKLNNYIRDEKLLDNFYYVMESDYDGELPEEIYQIHNSKKIKELNTETNEIIIYDSMKELYDKRGVCRETLRKCIKDNRICNKFKWSYVDDTQNKNNSKKVKETNTITNQEIIYNSMKEAYTKLNLTTSVFKNIIEKNQIVNNCKYEII